MELALNALKTGSLIELTAVLLAGSVLAGVGYLTAAWRYRRRLRHREVALAELDRLQDLRTLLAEVRAQGQVLQAIAAGLDRLDRHWTVDERHSLVPGRQGKAGYELAIRLARSGASVEELRASCGMTRGEAELVLRLHRDGDSPGRRRGLALTA